MLKIVWERIVYSRHIFYLSQQLIQLPLYTVEDLNRRRTGTFRIEMVNLDKRRRKRRHKDIK